MDTEAELAERVKNEKFIYLEEYTYAASFTWGDCDLTLTKEKFFKANFGFPVYKEFPYLNMFNQRIMAILESGFIDVWKTKHWPKVNNCGGLGTRTSHKPMQVEDTIGAYFILSIGLLMSGLVLCLELSFKFYNIALFDGKTEWKVLLIKIFNKLNPEEIDKQFIVNDGKLENDLKETI